MLTFFQMSCLMRRSGHRKSWCFGFLPQWPLTTRPVYRQQRAQTLRKRLSHCKDGKTWVWAYLSTGRSHICAKIQGRSGSRFRNLDLDGSWILGWHFVEGSSGSWILSTQSLRIPLDLRSCLEKLLLDPGDPGSCTEKIHWLGWVFDH